MALRAARQVEADTRQAHDEARRKAERLQTEVRTLTNLLKAAAGDLWPALVDQLKVEPGYETALGAALGDDIDASADEGAPVHWRGLPPLGRRHFPARRGAAAFQFCRRRHRHLRAGCRTSALFRRSLGQALQAQLRPGQRLVSREGDVWRWDGFTSAADAPMRPPSGWPSATALRFLKSRCGCGGGRGGSRAEHSKRPGNRSKRERRTEREKREAMRAATSAVEVARRALAKHERQIAERLAQTSALDEGSRRIAQSLDEARAQLEAAQAEFAGHSGPRWLAQEVAALRDNVNRERAAYAEARAKHDGLEREAKARAERLAAIEAERSQWGERAKRATEQIAASDARGRRKPATAIAELQACRSFWPTSAAS